MKRSTPSTLLACALLSLTGAAACKITPDEIAVIRDRSEVVDAENQLLREEIAHLKALCTKELELELIEDPPAPQR